MRSTLSFSVSKVHYRTQTPPAEYGYELGYYAVFFVDRDGLELEFVHVPKSLSHHRADLAISR
jgi:hypothetical protein